MIPYVILFLPSIICLFWAVLHTTVSSRTNTYRLMMALILDAMAFFFVDACYNYPGVSINTMLVGGMMSQFVTPCMVPLIALYMERLDRGNVYHPLQTIWIVIPAVLFTAAVVVFSVSEPQKIKTIIDGFYSEGWVFVRPYRGKAEYIYFVCTELLPRAILVLETLTLIYILLRIIHKHNFKGKDIINFWWKGQPIEIAELQIKNITILTILLSIKIVIFRGDVRINLWIPDTLAVLISIYIFKFCYLALFGTKKLLTLKDIRNSFRYNYDEKIKAQIVEEMMNELLDDAEEEALKRIQEKIGENLHIDQFRSEEKTKDTPMITKRILNAVSESWEEDSLMGRFQHLMIDEQAFLQPRLSLDDVAEQLNSNKTYISKLVNNSYNLGFPELINTLRIDYAEQYIINHREAKQEEIATSCGFLSASSFNTIFKKVTGMTPKVWIASIDKKKSS